MQITTLTSSATTRTPCHVLNKVNETVKYKHKRSKAIMRFFKTFDNSRDIKLY